MRTFMNRFLNLKNRSLNQKCPALRTDRKRTAISTLFLFAFGTGSWPVLACLWAIVPAIGIAMFAGAPMPRKKASHQFLALVLQNASPDHCLRVERRGR